MMVFAILHKRDKFTLSLIDVKNDHSDEIIVITFNENLQIFATASYDEYIFVYTFPNIKCIRSFHFSNYYANKIIISTNPLPMFVFYCEEVNEFKLFTINGSKIELEEDYILRAKTVTSFAKFTDFQYIDHLIIGTEDGYVIIMEFPKLKIETIVKVFKEKIKFSIPVLNGLGVLCYTERNKIFKLVHKDVSLELTDH
jgi:WD40 repeat protein